MGGSNSVSLAALNNGTVRSAAAAGGVKQPTPLSLSTHVHGHGNGPVRAQSERLPTDREPPAAASLHRSPTKEEIQHGVTASLASFNDSVSDAGDADGDGDGGADGAGEGETSSQKLSPKPPRESRPLLGSRGMSPGSAPLSPRARAAMLVGAGGEMAPIAHSAPAPAAKSAQPAFFFDTMSQREMDSHTHGHGRGHGVSPTGGIASNGKPRRGAGTDGDADSLGGVGLAAAGAAAPGGGALTRLNFDDSDDDESVKGAGRHRPPPFGALPPTANTGSAATSARGTRPPVGGSGSGGNGGGAGAAPSRESQKKAPVPIKTFSVDF